MTDGGAGGSLLHGIAAAMLCAALALLAPRAAGAHPDIDVVAREVDRIVAAHPSDPTLLVQQARIRTRAGAWDRALVTLALAAMRGADADAVAAARAATFLDAGFPELAQREFDQMLARRPDAPDLLFERGRTELALGEPEAADRDFARAIATMSAPRPEHVAVRAEALRARGLPADALDALDAGMARLGPLPALMLSAVDLEVALQRYDHALARLDTLLAAAPSNAAWIAARADVLRRAHRPAEARAELARALQQLEARPPRRRSAATAALIAQLRGELAAVDPYQEGHL